MTSTQEEIDESYSVSNDFFKLWLDENMHYTSAAWDDPSWSLERAQEEKARILYDFAELDETKTALDIGCGEGRFCRMMQAKGLTTIGIDPTEDLIEAARSRDPAGTYQIASG
ncbi:MAG: class I SAM-dependent methyltransferase, partial [Myxococcota bacterium]